MPHAPIIAQATAVEIADIAVGLHAQKVAKAQAIH